MAPYRRLKRNVLAELNKTTRTGDISGKGRWMHGTGLLSRLSTFPTDASVFSAAAFRDMNGVGKLPSFYSGTSSVVILKRRCFHLDSVSLRLQWSQDDPSRISFKGRLSWQAREGHTRFALIIAMQESRYIFNSITTNIYFR